jgi:alkylation response protein AidB-like acyl-CoA dehydrogenase
MPRCTETAKGGNRMTQWAATDWCERARAFVETAGRRYSEEIEDSGCVPSAAHEDLRAQGFLQLTAPVKYGGVGLAFTDYLEVLRILSALHGSLRVRIHVANALWRSLDARATAEQRERFVKPFVVGDVLATFTLSEPNSGSGADLKTTARRDGDEYIVNGEKWMIIFSDIADYFLLFCRLEGTAGSDGTLALIVPRTAPGLEIQDMPRAMGITGTAHGHLLLRDCRVPAANRLGAEGDGLSVAFSDFLEPSRIAVAMTCVGAAQRALELSLQHAHRRVTFGKTLAERPTIQMWLAEMATSIEAAYRLTQRAGSAFAGNEPVASVAAMAKLFATDMLQHVTDLALQIHGGIGYFSGELERLYRDARMQRFEEGTAEIQKLRIARELLRQTAPAAARPGS